MYIYIYRNEIIQKYLRRDLVVYFLTKLYVMDVSIGIVLLPLISAFLTYICLSICQRFEKEQGFTTLQLSVVQSKSLTESLQEFVRGDMLEGDNQYLCGECQEKVGVADIIIIIMIIIIIRGTH